MEDQPVFSDSKVDNITSETGIIDDLPVLSLKGDDRELISNFKRWVTDSKSYWNDKNGYDLETNRNKNERYFLGRQIDRSKLYAYQVPFVDNQIYVGTQAIMAYVTGQDPSCEITPEDDSPQSRVMAEDLETAVNIHTERFQLKKKVKSAVKNMYTKRVGIIKLKYDPTIGDIVPISLDPDMVILDKNCRLGEEPRFICEICTDTVGGLIKQFPDKEGKILEALGRQRKTPKLLSQVVAYNEIWFTDETAEDAESNECVAWYFNDLVLDKSKNPNFLYDNEGVAIKNFLDYPTKPYVFFNYINDGTHLIDQTTPIEQAIPLQDVLNKRGRQIVENADTANSLLVLKSGSIPDEDAGDITRDPNQVLMLDTPDEQPVSSAYGEIPPHLLPNYVIADKQDIKNSIHNILGTPSQFRGDDSDTSVGTLGEAQMMKSQASGRQDEIVMEIELSLDRYFRLLVQMMKVYYTDKKPFASRDNDGKFQYVELSRESMPNVANISIAHGSLLRVDRERRENVAMTMAKLGLIDPYNLFKDLGLKDADKRYEALVKFKVDPTSLVSDVKSEVQDRDAYIDFAVIMNGQDAQPRQEIQPSHILAHRQQMLTDRFLYADPKLQQAFLHHVQQEVQIISQRAKLEADDQAGVLVDPNVPITPQPPTPPAPQGQPMPAGGVLPGLPNMGGAPQPQPGQPQGQPAPQGAPQGMPPMPQGGGAPVAMGGGNAPVAAPVNPNASILQSILPGM